MYAWIHVRVRALKRRSRSLLDTFDTSLRPRKGVIDYINGNDVRYTARRRHSVLPHRRSARSE